MKREQFNAWFAEEMAKVRAQPMPLTEAAMRDLVRLPGIDRAAAVVMADQTLAIGIEPDWPKISGGP